MKPKAHWEQVYSSKSATEVSWFQTHADLSLKLIRDAGVPRSGAIIDVGGGASTLVDDLLLYGYRDISVLDLSCAALATAQQRIGAQASKVNWLEANILDVNFPAGRFDVWHDRAVFHFLTNEVDRQVYVRKVLHAVKPGGTVIVATFAEDGPTHCSGLPVMRYSADELHDEFGGRFELLEHAHETHHTPAGKEQQFVYCLCRRANS
jgi:2-polyprenyl-3-methyl-5-hydroxy-6-metoxy-1,4-benzoquinol methylase